MTQKTNGQNQSDRLIFQIYNQILIILYDRGIARIEKLSSLNISEKLGVSRTPVSFALNRLELEGMITKDDFGGWILEPLTTEDINEIFEVKEKLFPYIAYKAPLKISSDNSAKLLVFVDEIERALKRDDLYSWRAADLGFNRLLAISAKNERLNQFESILDNQLYRFLIAYLSFRGANKEIFKLYREIAYAVSSGNSLLASEKALQFVQELKVNLMQFMHDVITPLLGVK